MDAEGRCLLKTRRFFKDGGHAPGNAPLLGCTPSPIRYMLSLSGVTEASSSSKAGMVWPVLHLSH